MSHTRLGTDRVVGSPLPVAWVNRHPHRWALPMDEVTRLHRNHLVHWQVRDVLFGGDRVVFDEQVHGYVGLTVWKPFDALRHPRPQDQASPRTVHTVVHVQAACTACGLYARHPLHVAPTSAAPHVTPYVMRSCTSCGQQWTEH